MGWDVSNPDGGTPIQFQWGGAYPIQSPPPPGNVNRQTPAKTLPSSFLRNVGSNKKVLLRECKRHTASSIASNRNCSDTGVSHPVLTGGTLIQSLMGGYTIQSCFGSPFWPVQGTSPVRDWMGYPPFHWRLVGGFPSPPQDGRDMEWDQCTGVTPGKDIRPVDGSIMGWRWGTRPVDSHTPVKTAPSPFLRNAGGNYLARLSSVRV